MHQVISTQYNTVTKQAYTQLHVVNLQESNLGAHASYR